MRSLPNLSLPALVAAARGVGATTSYSTFYEVQQQLSPNAAEILADLDQYDKFWIEVRKSSSNGERRGSCVWSECGIDETDDAYMGDYRDGDEQWYQYRTQSFCANAAYSLYGRKKDQSGLGSGGWSGCSQKHFINSFFTYGGADNLLTAIGVEPVIYYSGDAGGDDDGNRRTRRRLEDAADDAAADDAAADDDDAYTASNSNCVEIDYEWDDDDDDDDEQEEEDDQGGNGDNGGDRRRLSGSQDQDGFGSSLGCSSEGDYIMGVFQSSSCDGNYFLEAVDTFDEYNAQHAKVGCHKIYQSKNEASYEQLYALLSNSWTCDVRLYPNACPDPFGEKGRFEFALRTAAHGGNAMWVYKNMIWKRPLRILSWTLLWLTVAVLVLAYVVKKRKRTRANGGGGRGLMLSAKEDILSAWTWIRLTAVACAVATRAAVRDYLKKMGGKRKGASNYNSERDGYGISMSEQDKIRNGSKSNNFVEEGTVIKKRSQPSVSEEREEYVAQTSTDEASDDRNGGR